MSDGVTIVEVALGDSASLLKLRTAAAAREAVRAIVPEGLLAQVKRWIR